MLEVGKWEKGACTISRKKLVEMCLSGGRILVGIWNCMGIGGIKWFHHFCILSKKQESLRGHRVAKLGAPYHIHDKY